VVIELDTREEVEVVEHSGPIPPNVSTVLWGGDGYQYWSCIYRNPPVRTADLPGTPAFLIPTLTSARAASTWLQTASSRPRLPCTSPPHHKRRGKPWRSLVMKIGCSALRKGWSRWKECW
jgi:hypothetical protein